MIQCLIRWLLSNHWLLSRPLGSFKTIYQVNSFKTAGFFQNHLIRWLLSKPLTSFKTIGSFQYHLSVDFFQHHWVLSRPFIRWLLSRPLGSFKTIHQLTSFKSTAFFQDQCAHFTSHWNDRISGWNTRVHERPILWILLCHSRIFPLIALFHFDLKFDKNTTPLLLTVSPFISIRTKWFPLLLLTVDEAKFGTVSLLPEHKKYMEESGTLCHKLGLLFLVLVVSLTFTLTAILIWELNLTFKEYGRKHGNETKIT